MSLINYEIDSDEEWEENEGGEEVGSNDERSSDGDSDEALDGFFVPAGHLSDCERDVSEDGGCEPQTEDGKDDREDAKSRFENWYISINKAKLKRLVPKCIGCFWRGTEEYEAMSDQFDVYRTWLVSQPVAEISSAPAAQSKKSGLLTSPAIRKKTETLTSLLKPLTKGDVSGSPRKKLATSPKQKRRKITITPINP